MRCVTKRLCSNQTNVTEEEKEKEIERITQNVRFLVIRN